MNTNLEVLFLLLRLVLLHFSASIDHLLVRIDKMVPKALNPRNFFNPSMCYSEFGVGE